MLDDLIKYCNSICPVSKELEEDLRKYALIKTFKKKDFLLKPGQVSNYAMFILHGLVRSYYLRDTEEITTKFLWDTDVISSYYSFYSRKPGYEYITALEDTTVACFHYDQMQQLYRDHMGFNVIGRRVTERYLFVLEIELFNLRKQKAEDSYRFFVKHFPNLIEKVPLKYIATYLGMNMETLSRVRAKFKL